MDDAGVDAADQESSLVDVTGLPLSRLVSSGDSALAHSLRRLLTELDQQKEVLAAFGNFAPDPTDPNGPADPPGIPA
jgi:FXSXX-COOH protein